MAWRCGASRATGPVHKHWAARPGARKPPSTRIGEAAVPVARANRRWAYPGASGSLDDAPHRPRLPSCPPPGPTDRPSDLYESLLRIIGIMPWFRRSRAGRAVLAMRSAGARRRQAPSRSDRADVLTWHRRLRVWANFSVRELSFVNRQFRALRRVSCLHSPPVPAPADCRGSDCRPSPQPVVMMDISGLARGFLRSVTGVLVAPEHPMYYSRLALCARFFAYGSKFDRPVTACG